jgi:hypothetical protein
MKSSNVATIACGLLLVAGSWSARAADATPAGSLCAAGEKIVFSCPLVGGKKTVSMCAAGDMSHGEGRFSYAFGTLPRPEFKYPGADRDGSFTRTHLVYAGASGGMAYSFTNEGYKYILYSISGTGLEDGGVLVQRPGDSHAAKDMKCQSGKITGLDDDAVIDATLKLKSDPDIESHGLPKTH